MDPIEELQRQIDELRNRMDEAQNYEVPSVQWQTTPLTSTSWDGDARSTTVKTVIDLSAVFGAPAGIKAAFVYTKLRDSGSAASTPFFILSPVDTATVGPYVHKMFGVANDDYSHAWGWVPCDANGDLYFQISASGAGTLDVNLEIWGYEV